MTPACDLRSRLKQPIFLLWAIAAVVQFVADWLAANRELPGQARLFFSFLPAAMWICVIAAFVLAVRRLDELQQRIQLQALSTGFILTAVLVLVFAGLERAGMYHATLGEIGSAAILFLGIGYALAVWKYR